MRQPLILPGQKGGVLTLDQMRQLIMALAKIQPTQVEMQLSLLARTLAVSAKSSGISEQAFFREMRKIWEETSGKELSGAAVAPLSSPGLRPPGLN